MAFVLNAVALAMALIIGCTIYLDRSFSELTSRVGWPDNSVYNKFPEANAGSCRIATDIDGACEDSVIDQSTGLVYFSCGNRDSRTKWFPGCNWWDKDEVSTNTFHVYDPAANSFEKLELDYEGQFVSHGLSLITHPTDADKRLIYSVNHKGTGSVITVFQFTVGSAEISHVGDIEDSRIVSPNSVAAYVEYDGSLSVMYTNDHLFKRGFMRYAEDTFGPFLWGSIGNCNFNIINGKLTKPSCSRVAVENSYPNGIAHIPGTKEFLVADTRLGSVSSFFWDFANKNLNLLHSTHFGAALDNIHIIPGTKDVVIAAFPNSTEVFTHFLNIDDRTTKQQSLAFRANHHENFTIPHVIQKTDGTHGFQVITSYNYLPEYKRLLGSSVCSEGILVCENV